jgi:hypothetical protein
MSQTKRLVILTGGNLSGAQEMVEKLKEDGYALIKPDSTSVLPVGKCNIKSDESLSLNIEDYSVIDRFADEYYAIKGKDISQSGSEAAVVVATPGMADKLYAYALKNNISPSVVQLSALVEVGNKQEQELSKAVDMATQTMSAPTTYTIDTVEVSEAQVKAVEGISQMIQARRTTVPDFGALRKEHLPDGRALELLKKIDAQTLKKNERDAITVGALCVAVVAAGAPAVGAGVLAAFLYSRKGMRAFNVNNEVLKAEGFSVMDRVKYFTLGNLVSDENVAITSKQELDQKLQELKESRQGYSMQNIVFEALDLMEGKLDDIIITSSAMKSICENFIQKVKDDLSIENKPITKFFNDVDINSEMASNRILRRG